MRYAIDPIRQPWLRRLVLGTAVVAGLAAAGALAWPPLDGPAIVIIDAAEAAEPPVTPDGAPDRVAPGPSSKSARPTANVPPLPAIAPPVAAATTPPIPAPPVADPADEPDTAADSSGPASEVTIDRHGVTVHKGSKHVNVRGFGSDREYDSFQDFVNDAPWLAGLVFMTVMLLFLTPLMIVVLLIWYKIRKTRMQNETMLRLAEKGVVPPAQAMEFVAPPAAAAVVPPGAIPLYEQAQQLRRRAAWSDLRKGVILVSLGLAFTFYSILDDGTPNWVGLILLFLGIGYAVLWFFEDRTANPAARRDAGPPPPGPA